MLTYNPRSNGQAERFVDTFKRALRKNNGIDTEEKSLQKFLAVYRITPNQNTNANLPPAEIMFARKIRSVLDRMLPSKKKKNYTKVNTKFIFSTLCNNLQCTSVISNNRNNKKKTHN